MSPGQSPPESFSRAGKRTARACDECRRLKIRCEFSESDAMVSDNSRRCRGCSASDIGCTFTAPVHKRGPPKGYLSALEQRLNDAEALLGALICSKDPRAASLISDLSNDPLAASIIGRVTKSEFGPAGRAERARSLMSRQFKQTETPTFSIDHNGHLVFTSPSNTWQDYLDMRLSLESKSRTAHALQHETQDVNMTPPTNQTSLQNSCSPEITESGLKDLHMRLYEEINSWLTPEDMVGYHGTDQADTYTNYTSSSSASDFVPHDDRGLMSNETSNSKTEPFEPQCGALYDILGLDKRQWEL